MIEKNIYTKTLLYDFYGELLNEHRRDVYEQVLLEDMSLSEVAQNFDISRQAVHDIVRKSENALNEYEEKLHLVERFMNMKKELEHANSLIDSDSSQAKKIIEEILENL